MNLEQQLLELLLSRPNSIDIRNMAEELEKESNFTLGNDIETVSYTHLTLPTTPYV